MPRKTPTPDLEPPDEVIGSDTPPQEKNGVNPPPYDATWITIKDAAARAGVTGQTVRNAYLKHEAFNPTSEPNEHGVIYEQPRWFSTLMVDQFGNATDYPVVYLDSTAVDAWIAARADKPSPGVRKPTDPKRYIVRLTDDQATAYNNGDYALAFDLPEGGRVALETPPQSSRKAKSASADQPAETNGQSLEQVPQGASLFDVDLVEA